MQKNIHCLYSKNFPKTLDIEISLEDLFNNGHTIEWSELPNRLWAITGEHIRDTDLFKRFGMLRNGIQHFGAVPNTISPSLATLEFIYKIIDPFIYKCWGLYAIDFDENKEHYIYFLETLISYEIEFLVSDKAIQYCDEWYNKLQNCSERYRELMKSRVQKAMKA